MDVGTRPLARRDDHGLGTDGDGSTNLEELRTDGNPANAAINAAQLTRRPMRCRDDSGTRVDGARSLMRTGWRANVR